ncbi:ABC transporter permease [Carnobacterium gallinarum]|uniref:ABC transporter permease n=1 Tax=Carnobacterium gallinarum TaxID=2749 RepID=UPI00055456DA|nr:iron ABC transporter permease [Carnobacterium gallinarum]
MLDRKKSFILLVISIGFITVLPMMALVKDTFFKDGQFDFSMLQQAIVNPRVWLLFTQSLKLGTFVVIGTTLLAFPLALITTKTSLAKYQWLDIIFTVPFMTPPYIGAMGWILFMQKNGFLVQFFPKLAGITPLFFSLAGMVIIMSLHLFPFLYLMLKNSLLQIEGSFQDAARIFGRNDLINWFKVSLPLLIPSYILGVLLIFIKTLAEFGTPITFGSRIGYRVFTTEIHNQLSKWPVNIQMAANLSFFLFTLCFIIWIIQNRVAQKFMYGTVSGKTKNTSYSSSRKMLFVSWFIIGFIVLFSIGIPYFSIIATSLMKIRGDGLAWGNFSLKAYSELASGEGRGAFFNSLEFAFFTTVITTIIGFFAGIFIQKGQKKTQKIIDFIVLMPNIIPGIVLVVGFILFWNLPWLPATIYNTKAMVVVTYSGLFLPYSVQYVKSNLTQLDASIMESAEIFGKNNFYTLFYIYLPLLKRGLLVGGMMTFIISMRELVGSLLILPPGVETSATYIYRQFEQGNDSSGMAMAVVTVLITILFMIAIEKLKKTEERK